MDRENTATTAAIKPSAAKSRFLNGFLGLALAILVGLAWLSYRELRAESEAERWTTHTYAVIQGLDRLLSALKDAETGQRGFLLTAREAYLEPYRSGVKQAERPLAALKGLTAGNPRQQKRLAEIQALIRKKEEELERTIELRRTRGLQASLKVVATDRGKIFMDQIRAVVAEAQTEEERLLQERLDRKAATTSRALTTVVVGGIVDVLLLSAVILSLKIENRRRFRAESELSRQRDHLQEMVSERTAALAESEERLRTLSDQIPGGAIYRLVQQPDRRLGFAYLSAGIERLVGMPAAQIMADTGSFLGMIVEEDRAGVAAAMELSGRELAPLDCEFRQHDAMGEVKWVQCRSMPHRTEETTVWDGIMMDITERKVAELEVRHRNDIVMGINRIFEAALSSGTDEELGETCLAVAEQLTGSRFGFIGEVHPDGLLYAIALSDPGWQLCSMYERSGRRRPPGSFHIHGLNGMVMTEGKGFFTNAPASHPGSIGLPEGHPPLEAFLGVPLKFGDRANGMVALGNREGGYRPDDLETLEALRPAIAEAFQRKRIEEALRQSEEQFRTLADSIPNLAWWANGDGYITWYNRRWYEYTGTTPEQMEGRGWQSVYDPQALPQVLERWQESIATGKPLDMTFPLRGADGTFRPFLTRMVPVFDQQGRIVRWFGTNTDITEAMEAEAELEKLIRLREFALDAAHVGWWSYDPVTGVSTWDDRFRKIFGVSEYQLPNHEIMARTLVAEDLPDLWAKVEKALDAADPQPFETQYRIRRPDGALRWIEAYGMAIFEELNGRLTATSLVGTVADVTERKEVSETLSLSEEKFSNAFHRNIAAMSISRLHDGLIIDVNDRWLHLFGFVREEVIGKIVTQSSWKDPEERPRLIADLEREGAIENREIDFQSKSGKEWIGLVSVQKCSLHGEEVLITSAIDITERKQAEAEVERMGRLMSEGQKIAHVGTFEYVAATQATVWSEEEYRIYGLDPAGPSPAYDVMLANCYLPEDAALLHRTFTAAVQSRSIYELEHRILRPDGSVRWVYDRAYPYFDDEGALLRYVGSTLDLTERREAEELVKASLAEKEVLLKEIHHRVKNNMQVISSLVSLQAGRSRDPAIREVLDEVSYRVRSMALVHEKLYQSADLAHIDFADYLRSLLSFIWRAHGPAAAEIRLNLDLERLDLPVDTAVPLGLMVNELAGNAIKHAFKGRKSGEVAVGLKRTSDSKVRLTVSDDGVGLAEGVEWRNSDSLGLRLVHMLAGQLKAEVNAYVERGTRFEIVLSI
jgi:PAS domain S-box-containing protein